MSLQTMYEGVVNSPATTITNDINSTDTIIYLLDPTNVPAELPNLMVLGTGANAETVKVLSIDGSSIEVERGFQGTARSWNSGTVIARNFTEYDYSALKENIEELEETKETPAGAQAKASAALAAAADYTDQEVDVVNSALGVHLAEKAKYATFTLGVAQSIPDATLTQMSFTDKTSSNGEDFTAIDTGRIKVLEAGIYDVNIAIGYAANATGTRGIYTDNGTMRIPANTGGFTSNLMARTFFQANANQLLNIQAYQNSGGSLDLLTGSAVTIRQVAKL